MLFNSLKFLLFFPVVTLMYFALPHRFRWLWLLAMSCVFYMAFVPYYILILGFTILVDYFAGILLENANGRQRKIFLIASIVANVGVLAVFKYYNFLLENFNALFHFSGSDFSFPLLHIILPIGLSFHTFQAMSYTIEVYRGNQKAEKHFGIYALYVMFYPQLVAGPIERPQNMLHQFHAKHFFDSEKVISGLRQMLWGFFKKCVVADRLAIYVDAVYTNHADASGANLFVATIFFALQIYADFSAYSDIALGSARIMGFDLMVNFNRPYASKSVTEFWRRWHISLSSWFNDYLFQPLTIATRNWGKRGIAFALFFTFFLAGLWHGAGWTFIIYGSLHGLALVYEFYTKKFRKNLSKKIPPFIYNPASMVLTFLFVSMAMIFFRSKDLSMAAEIFKSVFTLHNLNSFSFPIMANYTPFGWFSIIISIASVALMFLVEKMVNNNLNYFQSDNQKNILFSSAVLFLIVCFGIFNQTSFIYFQF